ncbi:MAG: hypothetical protein IJX91_02575 [Clostridia bacterium]|nr:hypothetical protein [Clostridia bacterium]
MTDKIILVFMCFAMLMCVYSTLVITRDIIKEQVEARKAAKEAKAAKAPAPAPAPQPVAEAPRETAIEAEPEIEPETESEPESVQEEVAPAEGDGVRFSSTVQTLEEKYLALTSEYKGYYDELVKYAAQVEDSKRYKNVRYEEYKQGKTRLVRLLIKRGVIHAELILQNSSFKSYVTENKISVKHAATVIKVLDETTVQAVKDAIDIAVKTAQDEREERKRLARERRRERRRKSNAANATTEKEKEN